MISLFRFNRLWEWNIILRLGQRNRSISIQTTESVAKYLFDVIRLCQKGG